MGWLIAALGTGLAVGGTVAIYFGAPYIRMEWGYSEVIAGTTALSAGILAVALAAILFALRDLKRLAAAAGPLPVGRPSIGPSAVAQAQPAPIIEAPVPTRERPAADVPDPLRAAGRAAEPALFAPAPGAPPEPETAPTVVGRYEANGASYVLFSNGSIEVETETGTHRYASMQDLRAHIEREDGG